MKAYINIKNDSDLHSHQIFNKWIWLMKREGKYKAIHHFSFGEPFDEALMKGYFNALDYSIINSSDFHPSSSPLWKRQYYPCLYAAMPAGNHAGATARNTMARLAKRERQRQAADTAAGFWEQKAIAY